MRYVVGVDGGGTKTNKAGKMMCFPNIARFYNQAHLVAKPFFN